MGRLYSAQLETELTRQMEVEHWTPRHLAEHLCAAYGYRNPELLCETIRHTMRGYVYGTPCANVQRKENHLTTLARLLDAVGMMPDNPAVREVSDLCQQEGKRSRTRSKQ